ncbi:hypothetical protein BDV93DRAFT_558648 [Ceratobasidium sp. AG-I]|nr:hypothetical protein BDV93DRAFT_558648 [Ceratobasidium sp. AG-I]
MPFTPIHTLIGAAMMGVSASHLLVLNGGVLGISGFAHRTTLWLGYTFRKHLGLTHTPSEKFLSPEDDPDPEHLALLSLVGLVAGGLVLGLNHSRLEDEVHAQLLDVYASNQITWTQIAGLALAGLLVGFGSKLSNGCTSGHMLCGVSRLAPRSLVASGIFVSVGIATHLLLGNLEPFAFDLTPERHLDHPSWRIILLLQIPILVYHYGSAFVSGLAGQRNARRLVAFSTSFHFALGLALSGMLRPSKILGFMNLTPTSIRNGTWDPSLLLVLVGGVLPQLIFWHVTLREYVRSSDTHPVFASSWSVPMPGPGWADGITTRLVVGAVLFGVGWGMCGICPGPAVVLIGAGLGGEVPAIVWRRITVWAIGFVVGGVLARIE